MRPVATVSTASSDHIRIAVRPISVALRGVIFVIASEAKQSRSPKESLDCFVASAPRNDGRPASYHILPAIDRQRGAGDGAGIVGGEEYHGAGDLLRFAEAVDRAL